MRASVPIASAKGRGSALGILADDWDWLGGSDVVTGVPVRFVGTAVEIFLDKLFSPRESVTSAHGKDYGRSGAS